MTHKHSVFDTDPHFLVDEQTRQITYQGDELPQIVQYDHNSEQFTIMLPKVIDGHDMTLCNDVRVNYINVDSQTKDTSKGSYEVKDITAGESEIACVWLVSGNATKYAGKLSFMLSFMCKENEIITYRWNTLTNSELTVGTGMENGEYLIEDYPDILEQWRNEVLAGLGDGTVKSVNGVSPDENGNVEIDIPEPEVPVTSVNGMTGDVVIAVPDDAHINSLIDAALGVIANAAY